MLETCDEYFVRGEFVAVTREDLGDADGVVEADHAGHGGGMVEGGFVGGDLGTGFGDAAGPGKGAVKED